MTNEAPTIKSMNFAQRMRLIWIDSRLECGPINRADIMSAFEISRSQAALDLRAYRRCHPKKIEYNANEKHYLRPKRAQPAYPQNLRLQVSSAVRGMHIFEGAIHG